MDNTGKSLRDDGIELALANSSEDFKAHYQQTMAQFFATIRVGGTFRIEEGHSLLKLRPHHPNALGANSSGFIKPKLKEGSVIEAAFVTSDRPANHATRTRVYQRIR